MKKFSQNYSAVIYFPLHNQLFLPKLWGSSVMSSKETSLSAPASRPYDEVVAVSRPYFGPAAKRFVDRQIRNHLAKRPQQLSGQDLPLLLDWIRVAVAHVSDDRELITEYLDELASLTHKHTAVR